MALFPDAKFTVYLPSEGVIPGTRVDGSLHVAVPADIPRAMRIDLFFRSVARAHYPGNSDGNDYVREIFVSPLRIELDRSKPLARGEYTYPFAIDVPPWLPPGYVGSHCSIKHVVEARLDVDWAIDPTTTVTPTVVAPPKVGRAKPITTRSKPGFHEDLVIDVTLDSNTLVEGDPIGGAIALRGGGATRFTSITLVFASVAAVVMARGERRRGTGMQVRIPADVLRRGESVPFRIRYPSGVPPTFRTGFIDHELVLGVDVESSWGVVSGFEIPLHVLPAGSTLEQADPSTAVLGSGRLVALAASMAEETGFAVGRLPILIGGAVGPLRMQVADGPRHGRIGLDVEMEFPDVELGIVFRPLGALEGFRQSPLLLGELAASHFLRVEPERAEGGALAVPVPERALATFFDDVLRGFDAQNEVRLSDHHLGFHLVLRSDGTEDMIGAARWVKQHAETIVRAIGALPFPELAPTAEAAWRATAREQNAFLLPHVPAIHGIRIGARIMGGEARELGVTLRTRHDRTIAADLDLRLAPLPPHANLATATAVTAVFPRFVTHSPERITLGGAAFVADPRPLLGTLETFLAWLLEVRKEKRTDSPYR